MAWVVDTSVVLDLVTGDPDFEPSSVACLQSRLGDGLVVCPVTFVELGPSFSGNVESAEAFLNASRIGFSEGWSEADTALAHQLWHQHQLRRQQLQIKKRPVADILIAAFASRFQGFITRNASDFRKILPSISLIEP
jgi:predicted nucleic acid-binding protein